VEIYAMGPAESLAAFHAELKRGPGGASVSGVSEEDAPIDSRFARSFSIER